MPPDHPPLQGAARHLLGDDALLRRWPHLRRPGPQPHNQIGTIEAQLAYAMRGRRRRTSGSRSTGGR